MYATARLTPGDESGALAVPAASVIRVLDRQLVFKVVDNTARAADVKTGLRDGDYIEILEGLSRATSMW